MPDKIVVQLATEIASKSIQDNILFYLIATLLSVVASAGAAYLGAYWKKRGEAYAASADFGKVISQLEKTTETAATINLTLQAQFSDAAVKKTLLREKLEEFVTATYELTIWIEKARRLALDGEAELELTTSPINKIETYQKIYFRELDLEVAHVRNGNLAIHLWLVQQQNEVKNAKNENRTAEIFKFGNTVDYMMPLHDALDHLRIKIIETYSERAGL